MGKHAQLVVGPAGSGFVHFSDRLLINESLQSITTSLRDALKLCSPYSILTANAANPPTAQQSPAIVKPAAG